MYSTVMCCVGLLKSNFSVNLSLQKESVALAVRLIDESEVRGYKLHVEAARFELKGQYDASKKKKKSKDYKKKMHQQQK